MNRLDVVVASEGSREDLAHFHARLEGRDDLVDREHARHVGDLVEIAELADVLIEVRGDDELRTRENRDAHRRGVEHRASTDDVGGAFFFHEGFDDFLRARDGEGDFQTDDASVGAGLGELDGLLDRGAADDGDDAAIEQLIDDFVFLHG